MSKPTVHVVDDDSAIRDSLQMLIDSVGLPARVYASAGEFLSDWSEAWQGCLVADIRMPAMNGLELQKELARRGSRLPIIFITGHGDVPMAVEAMKAGALDFVSKPFRDQELLDRIHEGLQSEQANRRLEFEREEIVRRRDTLTPRERQVMERVVAGEPNKAIAIHLDVNPRTVEIHRARAMQKMQAGSLAQLVQMISRIDQFAGMRQRLELIVEERTQLLREKTLELERLASQDQLTGLFNRRFADETLRRCIEEHERYRRGFAIALIDLDHFKSINDHHSHEIGDEVLRRVSRLLGDRCRETDMVARYGGEEFLLCFPETDTATAAAICEQLRQAVESTDWSTLSPGLKVSLSAGIAEMRPGQNRSDLVSTADRRLYKAKHAGRNLVVLT